MAEPVLKVKKEIIDAICKNLVDRGLLVEAGWMSFKVVAVPSDATISQHEDLRCAFFAGAQHLWGSIMSILDPGAEPTDADLNRMNLIHEELKAFIESYKSKHLPPEGHA